MEAAKLLVDLAKQTAEKKVQALRTCHDMLGLACRVVQVHPLRVKKLYVLAAFEVRCSIKY
jgi:hypothetical protein